VGGGDEQARLLVVLSSEVDRMPSFYEEAEKAREECRKRLNELHSDTMRQIQLTRDHGQQKSRHVQDTMKSFTAKFDHELCQMRDELRKELMVKSSRIEGMINELDRRMVTLEVGLEEQHRARVAQTEDVLGPIRDEVNQITTDLERERQTRRREEEELEKTLADKIEVITKKVDEEKFAREQQYVELSQWTEKEQQHLAKRQCQVEKETCDTLRDLRHDLQVETKDRIACQDTIVEDVASFIKRFNEQLSRDSENDGNVGQMDTMFAPAVQ